MMDSHNRPMNKLTGISPYAEWWLKNGVFPRNIFNAESRLLKGFVVSAKKIQTVASINNEVHNGKQNWRYSTTGWKLVIFMIGIVGNISAAAAFLNWTLICKLVAVYLTYKRAPFKQSIHGPRCFPRIITLIK